MTEVNPQIEIYRRLVIEECEVSRILDIGYLIFEYHRINMKHTGSKFSN